MQPDVPAPWLRRLWERMTSIYGHAWISVHGTSPQDPKTGSLTIDGDTWARALAGVTGEQLGRGLDACILSGGEFPPSAGRFRALCFGIPGLSEVRHALRADGRPVERVIADCPPFARLVWQHIDGWTYKHADARAADRMLSDAYDAAREHVLAGGALPDAPVAAVENKPAPKREMTDAEREIAREAAQKAMQEIAAELRMPA